MVEYNKHRRFFIHKAHKEVFLMKFKKERVNHPKHLIQKFMIVGDCDNLFSWVISSNRNSTITWETFIDFLGKLMELKTKKEDGTIALSFNLG